VGLCTRLAEPHDTPRGEIFTENDTLLGREFLVAVVAGEGRIHDAIECGCFHDYLSVGGEGGQFYIIPRMF